MDNKYRGSYPQFNDPPAAPKPRRVFTTTQMAHALTQLLAGRDRIRKALEVVPNSATREQLETSLKASIEDIVRDICNLEDVQ